ncbi:uncharacterized protein LOC141641253 [Silene latifolia]|uniref:uncharacterized protein LOC141641253 n=1 Tax=Silene latifolia TaxID=37657 RepID=UPI003D772566
MVHGASGGGIINKNPDEANELLSELAESTRQFSVRSKTRRVSMASSNPSLESKVGDLTSLIREMIMGNKQQVHACGICSFNGHVTDQCPQMQEETEEVNDAGAFGQPQKRFEPYYNPLRRYHPGFQYGNPQGGLQPPNQKIQGSSFGQQGPSQIFGQQFGQSKPRFIPRPQGPNSFSSQVLFGRLEARDSGKLPSETIPNPKPNASAITLRSGKELQGSKAKISEIIEQEEELVIEPNISPPLVQKEELTPVVTPTYVYSPPFPEALKRKSRPTQDKDVYETFRKCEVNIPLLDLLKSVPRYAKFLKELCTIKRNQKLKGVQKVKVNEHVSALFQHKLPPKCSDPGMFIVPCTLGDTTIPNAMLNLGASTNVLPYSLYKSLKLGPFVKTGVVIQLADRSNAYPKGVVEDVLVMVDKLIFSADFYVLEMEHDSQAAPILLGRPFFRTASTKIDVSNGSLIMEADGQVVKFNIYDSMKYPCDDHSCFMIDVLEPLVQDVVNVDGGDE